jgi:hypothetical protein
MVDKNGIAKNFEVVRSELKAWRGEMAVGFHRLKGSSLRFDKTNVFHVLTNFIEETFDKLPRTLTYLTILGAIGTAVSWMI